MERPVAELGQALEEHVLDPHVVVEVLEVHEAVERRTGMGVDRGAAVQRQRQFEITTRTAKDETCLMQGRLRAGEGIRTPDPLFTRQVL